MPRLFLIAVIFFITSSLVYTNEDKQSNRILLFTEYITPQSDLTDEASGGSGFGLGYEYRFGKSSFWASIQAGFNSFSPANDSTGIKNYYMIPFGIRFKYDFEEITGLTFAPYLGVGTNDMLLEYGNEDEDLVSERYIGTPLYVDFGLEYNFVINKTILITPYINYRWVASPSTAFGNDDPTTTFDDDTSTAGNFSFFGLFYDEYESWNERDYSASQLSIGVMVKFGW